MDYFYDGQVRRYLTQFMRIMSNFSYKDAKGNLIQVPVRYGDMSRQVATILSKNSENIVQSAPFIACYIKDMQFDRERLQDPTFVSKVNIRERAKDDAGNLLNVQGENYTVERLMPTPYKATFTADIWTTNTEQKLQLWEQIAVLFNPALEIQTTDNFLDWTSLSYIELATQQFETRTVPQGLESEISIATLTFNAPIWITPPAKVRKLGIVTKIIANIFNDPAGTNASGAYADYGLTDLFAGRVAKAKIVISPNNYNLLVLDNQASLLPINDRSVDSTSMAAYKNKGNWRSLLDVYPGEFVAGLSQIRLTKPEGGEIVARVSLNPTDDQIMSLNFDEETIYPNTEIDGGGKVNAIVDPLRYNPNNPAAGTRYLILDDIVAGPEAWRNLDGTPFEANANDIISWNGYSWSVIFNSQSVSELTFITNSYTGIQYKWDGQQWSKSFEGVYDPGAWRLIL